MASASGTVVVYSAAVAAAASILAGFIRRNNVSGTVAGYSAAAVAAASILVGFFRRYKASAHSSLQNRPKRSGMWFVVDNRIVPSIEFEETINIHEEFFRRHPNGSEATKGIVAVKLSEAMIDRQLHRIRMSSYRWFDVSGVPPSGECPIPRNYNWFLERVKDDGYIGWMDFIANVGVNCNVEEVIKYMGGLYARLPTLGAWMYDIERLDEAMYRGWIYQETAFGALDEGGCRHLFALVRKTFVAMHDGEKDAKALDALFRATSVLGKLIHRRGFEFFRDRNPLFKSFTFDRYEYGGSHWVTGIRQVVAPRIPLISGSPLRVTGPHGDSPDGHDGRCDYTSFGAHEPFAGIAVWAEPECAETALTNPSELEGRIAIVRCGQVTFIEKAEKAMKAGAIALIVVNTTDAPFRMGGGKEGAILIPVVNVSSSTGEKLVNGAIVTVSPRKDVDLIPKFEEDVSRALRSITPLVCLDVFTMDEQAYAEHADQLCSFLTTPSYALANNNADDFGELFGGSIVHAYLEAALTYEEDREAAICSVASYIYSENFKRDISTSEMLREAWQGLYRIDSKNCDDGHCMVTSCPNVLGSNLGLGERIFGAKVMDNHGYASADNTAELCELPGGAHEAMRYLILDGIVGAYRGDSKYALPSSSNMSTADTDKELLELFVCEAPEYLQGIARASREQHDGVKVAAIIFVTKRVRGSATRKAGSMWSVLNWIQVSDMTGSDPDAAFTTPLRMPSHDFEFG